MTPKNENTHLFRTGFRVKILNANFPQKSNLSTLVGPNHLMWALFWRVKMSVFKQTEHFWSFCGLNREGPLSILSPNKNDIGVEGQNRQILSGAARGRPAGWWFFVPLTFSIRNATRCNYYYYYYYYSMLLLPAAGAKIFVDPQKCIFNIFFLGPA